MKARLFWKVLGNFSLLLVVLTAVTLVTLNILSQIEGHFTVASTDSRQLIILEQLNKYISEMPAVTDEYLHTGKDSVRAIYDNAWKDFDGITAELQRDVRDTTVIRSLEKIRNAYYAWIADVGEKKMLLRNDYATGQDISQRLDSLAFNDAQNHHLTDAREKLHYLITDMVTTQPEGLLHAKKLSEELKTYIIVVNLLLAFFAVALGLVLTRSITRPIQLLKVGTQGIMDGNFTPLALNRKDELGELASDFNKMSAMLGNNYTRLKAYSELVTILNSQESISDIETKSLDLLCFHSNAAVGALYLLNDIENSVELVAGHGLKSKSAVNSFAIGEGLPGQCAGERKSIELSNITTSAGFVMDTGLIEIMPQHVIASPIFIQDKILGVLILGSLSRFSELDKEIIDNSLPQLGIAIANAMNYDETQKLSREVSVKNTELNTKNSELEKAYRVKSEFLASMSHELRTPLNSIIGFSSVLLGPNSDPLTQDQRKALEKVLKNGRHLLQLINDILDFSKLESGRMSINIEADDVENVVSSSVMTIESLAKAKEVSVVQTISPNLPLLQTDVLKIKQILVNLLSNAVKFTEQGEITVSVTQRNDMLVFAVKDSGIGIEQKNYEKVFEEFQQIDNSNTRKYKGTGLGLPISRRLARLLGGDLTVESEFGKGSTFILTVPSTYVEIKEDQTVHVVRKEEKQVPPAQEKIIAPVLATPPLVQTPKPSVVVDEIPSNKIQVLCIDDDPEVIEILKSYLVPEGFSVVEANSGDEGIAKAEKLLPAIITLDIMMPHKDGWQVLRELKQNPKTKSIPVVIHSIIENRPLALSLGAVDVITKPTDSMKLLSLIKREYHAKEQYVLLVDDDEDFTLAMQKILKAGDVDAKIANSGKEALNILSSSRPAVIFCDLNMPEMDGFELVQRLQNNEAWSSIPVVILSGKELSEDEWTMLNKYITEYVKKSDFTPETLTSVVKRILKKK
ncbi:MAG: response regulator [Bacteroidota bacterium]|nr:response regulator [Bacteroidota bacterium]